MHHELQRDYVKRRVPKRRGLRRPVHPPILLVSQTVRRHRQHVRRQIQSRHIDLPRCLPLTAPEPGVVLAQVAGRDPDGAPDIEDVANVRGVRPIRGNRADDRGPHPRLRGLRVQLRLAGEHAERHDIGRRGGLDGGEPAEVSGIVRVERRKIVRRIHNTRVLDGLKPRLQPRAGLRRVRVPHGVRPGDALLLRGLHEHALRALLHRREERREGDRGIDDGGERGRAGPARGSQGKTGKLRAGAGRGARGGEEADAEGRDGERG
mmetsp:Transcript_12001/g.30278  ORF Transcript_12001/g.30278 Transcript_12001/m.30278 type:complete len:264 (-) Transcript_12001:20-811(-)